RDQTFGLVSDVDHGAVGVDGDDGADHDVAFVELQDGVGNGCLEVVDDVVGQLVDAGRFDGYGSGGRTGWGICDCGLGVRVCLWSRLGVPFFDRSLFGGLLDRRFGGFGLGG